MFQLLSIYSPFLCALSQKFYKIIFFNAKNWIYVKKPGFKKKG